MILPSKFIFFHHTRPDLHKTTQLADSYDRFENIDYYVEIILEVLSSQKVVQDSIVTKEKNKLSPHPDISFGCISWRGGPWMSADRKRDRKS